MAKIRLEDGKKVSNLIKKTIAEAIQEVLNDPDRGLELQDWVKKRLNKPAKRLIDFKEAVRKGR